MSEVRMGRTTSSSSVEMQSVLQLAVVSRILVLSLIVIWRCIATSYDTSSSLNPPCLSTTTKSIIDPHSPLILENERQICGVWSQLGKAIEGSVVWDSVYYVRIAQCGYEYEQSYAFLPLLPLCMRFLSKTVFSPLVPLMGYRAVLALSGYILNNIAFVFAALFLYKFRKLKQQQRMESKLEFPQSAILTPYNYFEWKPKIQLHLRSRGLFRITMEMEVEPTSAMEKTRYFNRMDEAFGILCLSIFLELLFHVESCSTPNEVWKTFALYFEGGFSSHWVFPLSSFFMHCIWVPKMAVLPGLIHFASHSPKLCLRGGVSVHALRLAVLVYMHLD